ncbi:MAG: PKD domain-containing protein [Lentisphaerae bacterium]|jgi:hypothetical protein|nr:PKD domain-containing protein [Lentisphaerota bacterium]MBT4816622.1 PKD domain-containing protein [Lentisphaerota bacterium]MBT5604661.1 PKD domain-containing protein [Lentisphaerota bacterium]MBT7057761.1 PKD domain-containing protein [Lentisphaerota bacterium]MBT7843064.1 PKD domain-containing protein [Lentisphaerota bacterium]
MTHDALEMNRCMSFLIGLVLGSSSWVGAATLETASFDSAGIEAAIVQATPGDTIILGAGEYRLTQSVSLKSGLKFVGAGRDRTTLVYRGKKPTVFLRLSRCDLVELAHFTLDGESNGLIMQGISGSNSRRLFIHHVTIRDLVPTGAFGPFALRLSGKNPTCANGVTDSEISDCLIENIGVGAKYGGGIRLEWGSGRNRVLRNVIRTTGRGGIFGDHSPELVIQHNRVSGSGGTGLGIEIWGGCHRSVIEDNRVDHWVSVDRGNQSAVRRNLIGTDDGTLKGYGIEIIARDVVVTDNAVTQGAHIGLSISNKPVKNNVFWGYNTVRDCIQWGAQFQGEKGGIAQHYLYRCTFEKTVRGDVRARYKKYDGHGFRTNGFCRNLVFEECEFRDNGGYGVQLGGKGVDLLSFVRCKITGNAGAAVTRPAHYTALQFPDCEVADNGSDRLPETRPFGAAAPTADFAVPDTLQAGQTARFRCTSAAAAGDVKERLWDFDHGIPALVAEPEHTYQEPGDYRVTLIVWDGAGRGARAEKTIHVLPAK